MMIYVNGQEISQLVLGVIKDGQWRHEPKIHQVRPEEYLATWEAFLRELKIDRAQIEGFVLVKGPGSATALRTVHAMVNALAFALNVKVTSIEKSPSAADADMLTAIAEASSLPFALPVYAHDPNITATKRDALKRKTS